MSPVNSVGVVHDANIGLEKDWCISPDSCIRCSCSGCSTGWCGDDSITPANEVTAYSNSSGFMDTLAPSNGASTLDIVGSGGYATHNDTTTFGHSHGGGPLGTKG